jgi:hypothetical protein
MLAINGIYDYFVIVNVVLNAMFWHCVMTCA